MEPPKLTATTIRYLYATTWLPGADGGGREHTVQVPAGKTRALDTAANLIHTALWNLRRQGVFDFEQLRPVENESVMVLGSRSFTRFEFRDPGIDLRGLEGALIRAARKVRASDGVIDRAIQRVTDEDEHGMRRLIYAMDLNHRAPWLTVTSHCFVEAKAAGLVEETGWATKKVKIVDEASVESLRERNDELRAARKADMDREPDLHHAVIADGVMAVNWAMSSTSTGH